LADEPPSLSAEQVERLTKLSKIWGKVRYLHPYLGYKDIDWDEALVKAVPKVVASKSTEEYVAAVRDMLSVLHDPATGVFQEVSSGVKGPDKNDKSAEGKLFTWVEEGILAIHLSGPPDFAFRLYGRRADLAALAKELPKASGVIADLRDGYWPSFAFGLEKIETYFPAHDLVLPANRYLVHSGYRPQDMSSSGGYGSAFHTDFLETLKSAGGTSRRTVFLVNGKSEVPPLALALQQAGEAYLVSEGKLVATGARVETLPLTNGFAFHMRLTQLVDRAGVEALPHVDAEVSVDEDRGPSGPAFKAALALLKDKNHARKSTNATEPLPPAVWRADRVYGEMTYPDLGYRFLALSRLWNVIHYFYPYHHLIGDWDGLLPQFVPKFASVKNAREYALAVAEMAAHVADNHTRVSGSPALKEFFGEFLPQVSLRLIEGEPVVVQVWDEVSKQAKGPRVGDVVVKVDGEPVKDRMARLGKYLPGSTDATHTRNILRVMLGGPKTSPVKLTLRRTDGDLEEVEAPRSLTDLRNKPPERDGEVVRVLSDNLGYVDLARLTLPEIDPLFEKLKETAGIIFDMRGYPVAPVAWYVAPRLNTKKALYAAAFQRRLVSGPSSTEDRFAFLQRLPSTEKPIYQGKTVMLIDERTQSAAEHTGLFFEAACGTTFIGSHTSGANGDVTSLVLPGGISVMFTGHDVRHADGRQLQRIGLVPHIKVAPTIKGVRDGRDEVLERAITFLQKSK
jgi:C-terminal processing protease CtpA/Prc